MSNFRNRMMTFMYGRYGIDELYYGLFAVSILIAVINMFVGSLALYIVGVVSLGFMIFRYFSRKHERRRRENRLFLKLWKPIKSWFILQRDRFRDRKTTRYRRCPACKAIIKLPNKKGSHSVRCPRCGERFGVRII